MTFDKATLAWTLPWDIDWTTAVTFIGSTRRIAAANILGQILLWELPEKAGDAAPKPIRRLDGHTNSITKLLSTSDGRWLISSSYDHTIRFWDMQANGTGEESIALNERTRDDLKRRGGKMPPEQIAKVSIQQAAKVIDTHKEWVMGLSISRDEQFMLSGDDAGEVILWNLPERTEIRRWKVKGWAYAITLSPDAKQALISERMPVVFDGGRHAGLQLWDATTGKSQFDLSAEFKGQHIGSAAYSPDGKMLVVGRGGEGDGKLTIVDPKTGKKGKELTPMHQYGVTDLVSCPDGKHFASTGRDTVVRIWDLEGKMIAELGKPRGGQFKDWLLSLSFSPDGKWLVAADMIGAVQVWTFPT